MMNRSIFFMRGMLAAVLSVMVLAAPVAAQESFSVDPESKLWIEGTSTKSDWTVYAPDIDGSFGLAGEGDDLAVSKATFVVAAPTLESRKSTIMDRLMRGALKVEEHPEIKYVLKVAEPGAEALTYNTQGSLTLGGATKDIDMVVTAEPLGDGKVRFTGSHPMKMSDYGLDAPTAMFGALRTGDEVTVHFDVIAAPGG